MRYVRRSGASEGVAIPRSPQLIDAQARADVRLFLAIRLGVWLCVAFALLWAPLAGDAVPPFRAYDGVSDLLFGSLAQWDAVWFIHLADNGYDSTQITAFFPFYPLLVSGLSVVTRSTVVAGVLLSLAAGCVAVVMLRKVAATCVAASAQRDAILLVSLYPLSFVFTSVYSDGPFLALALGAFYAGLRRRPLLAGALAALAVDTRIVGLALIPALAVMLWPRERSSRERAGPGRRDRFCRSPRSARTPPISTIASATGSRSSTQRASTPGTATSHRSVRSPGSGSRRRLRGTGRSSFSVTSHEAATTRTDSRRMTRGRPGTSPSSR